VELQRFLFFRIILKIGYRLVDLCRDSVLGRYEYLLFAMILFWNREHSTRGEDSAAPSPVDRT
jgi:hypothetical protein